VAVDTLRTDKLDALPVRIAQLADQLEKLIDEHKPELIALERVFSQANVSTVMGTAQISGVVMLIAQRRGIAVQMHTPTEVKAAVTGSGRANKQQVGSMVAKILKLDAIPKPADSADALAIAITAGWRVTAPSAQDTLTKAQAAWQSAELASKKKRGS
jgi:crossover junction endodeoxyribonuclease RuvC